MTNTNTNGAKPYKNNVFKDSNNTKNTHKHIPIDIHKGRPTLEKRFRHHPTNRYKKYGNQGDIRVVPLGGLGEVGQNMMFIEWDDDIIVIDTGILFASNTELGVDGITPNIDYLIQNKHKIRGIIYTHGHLDHIGAAKYILPQLNFPVCYGSQLTRAVLLSTTEESNINDKIKWVVCDPTTNISLGKFHVEFFHVNHTIPDNLGIAISTPYGYIVNSSDFKFDYNPADGNPADMGKIAELGSKGVVLGMIESTNSMITGFAPSEHRVIQELEDMMKKATGRIIITLFGSSIGRVARLIECIEKLNKTAYITGRSLIKNTQIARELGYFKAKKGTVVELRGRINMGDPKHSVILCTGGQGEEFAALTRAARGEHKLLEIHKSDTIIFSSSDIPVNVNKIRQLKDQLIHYGCRIVSSQFADTHATGHGYQEDLKLMNSLLNPLYFAPIHGSPYTRNYHKEVIMRDLAYPENHIMMMENGHGVLINQSGVQLIKRLDAIKADKVYYEMGEKVSTEAVMRRYKIATDGLIMAIIQTKPMLTGTIKTIAFLDGQPQNIIFQELQKRLNELLNANKTVFDTDKNKGIYLVQKQLRMHLERFMDKRIKEPEIEIVII